MSIAKAWYVRCDGCGNPAEISVEGAVSARRYAKECDGFVRIKINGVMKDLCPACNPRDPRQ